MYVSVYGCVCIHACTCMYVLVCVILCVLIHMWVTCVSVHVYCVHGYIMWMYDCIYVMVKVVMNTYQ